jgi:uncharacterized protein
MILNLEIIIVFLLLGCAVGFLAGLLGIGGGGLMVPVLTSVFLYQGLDINNVVHIALGTSMASIIAGSVSSFLSHHKRQAVDWQMVKIISFGVLVGAFLATFLVAYLDTKILTIFFMIFMAFASFKMIKDIKPRPTIKKISNITTTIIGSIIGAISSMVSIGGGTMSVPFLLWQKFSITKAVGTSAAIGTPIAVAATIGFVISGRSVTNFAELQFGFVYLPAVFVISIMSVIFAPLGVALAHKIATKTLKRIFATLLLLLSIKMFMMVFLK